MADQTILDEAKLITTGDRRRDYGAPLINFLRIAIGWSVYLGVTITPTKVAWMMIQMKVAREANTPKKDNLTDVIGYAACVDNMVLHAMEHGINGDYEHVLSYLDTMSLEEMAALLENIT